MYIPKQFLQKDLEEAKKLVYHNSFATLVSTNEGKPWASHIPLHLMDRKGQWYLQGHVARANPQWKTLSMDSEVLAIFQGAHAYISPSWYDHPNVPTWNYSAVHLYGRCRILEGEELIESLRTLMHIHESTQENPMRMDDPDKTFLEDHFKGLVAFEMKVKEIKAVQKLSQNRDDKNYHQVIEALKRSKSPMEQNVAEEMLKIRKKKD
jgi:transcriptional regulator